MRRKAILAISAVILLAFVLLYFTASPVMRVAACDSDARLANAWRFERSGWVYVHLEGRPEQLGYQHGYLLAPEIRDAWEASKLVNTHDSKRDWAFFRDTAEHVLWPHIDAEYQQELTGIAAGLNDRYVSMDLWDVVALNAMESCLSEPNVLLILVVLFVPCLEGCRALSRLS